MSRITNFDTLPSFSAASFQGPAIAATFPASKSASLFASISRFVHGYIVRWRTARAARQTIDALSELSDRQLHDIGLERANIVSSAMHATSTKYMVSLK